MITTDIWMKKKMELTENLWKKLILSERSPKIFLRIDDSTPPWLAVQEVLSCCLLFEHRSCTVTVLGWQRHKQSHMFAYCTYKKKMSGSYSVFSAINTTQVHFAARAFDMVWADGLNETLRGFSNSPDRKTGHTGCPTALRSPPQGPQSPCGASGHSWWVWECSPFCY